MADKTQLGPGRVLQESFNEATKKLKVEGSFSLASGTEVVITDADDSIKIGKDVRQEDNWFSKGVICSELIYYFFKALNTRMAELVKDFNPNTIQAEDINQIFKANPHIFKEVMRKV